MSLEHDISEYLVTTYLPGTPAGDLDPSLDLFDSGVMSSLQLLQLIDWLRGRYRLPIEDLEISPASFRSVTAIRHFIEDARGTVPEDGEVAR
ncbi:acyl carrier protein [Streptomyces sp. NPDC048636]|uniref:acyl carrier protein n=1 Tax=Streptomyces sp. NPDC048636 TaxID=3155762 RepID=UPI00343C7309